MDKEAIKNLEKGKATEKDFPYTEINEKELKAKISQEARLKLFDDEIEFNKEVQLFVLNKMHERALTTNYVVGTLFKLAWGIMETDHQEQIRMYRKFKQGGR